MLSKKEIEKLGNQEKIKLLEIYEMYNRELSRKSLMDYDDQMVYALNLLKSIPEILEYFQEKYQFISVDEAQDTSKVQHEIIRILGGKYKNIFMVEMRIKVFTVSELHIPKRCWNLEKHILTERFS